MTFTHTSKFVVVTCYKCGIDFGVPAYFDEQCHRLGQDKQFFCPNGHGQVYTKSEAQKLREQLANEKQARSWAEEAARRARQDAQHFESSRNAYKGQVKKLKKRVASGICPCCNESFDNLKAHMASEHPAFENQDYLGPDDALSSCTKKEPMTLKGHGPSAKNVQCPKCGRWFKNKNSMRAHDHYAHKETE